MQIITNGLISGLIISLLAVAFQAVYLPTRIFYIGLAGIYSITPYIAYSFLNISFPWPLAICAAILFAVALSISLEFISHSYLARKMAGPAVQLIASLGLYIVIVQITVLIWGNETRVLRNGSDSVIHILGVIVTGSQLIALCVAIISIISFIFFLRKSHSGLRFRALSENSYQFALYGFNVKIYRYIGFSLAGCFAAISSLLIAYDIGFTPHEGLRMILVASVAVIVGGQNSFLGPILGALTIGLLRAEIIWLYSARWQEAATFALLVLFLLIRPQGIVGKTKRLEAIE
jgi:branched-chain amino acid transport system permease protein